METNDRIILRKLKQGDYFTFEFVFKKYQPKLFAIAFRIVKDEEKAHEIVHDVFLKLWANRKQIEVKKTLEAYLVVKVKSYSINAFRLKMKDKNLVSEIDIEFYNLETTYYQDEQITQHMNSENLKDRYLKAVSELPDQQQLVFKLSRMEGYTAQEIAKKINIARRTVETHIYQALKTIKSKLKDLLN